MTIKSRERESTDIISTEIRVFPKSFAKPTRRELRISKKRFKRRQEFLHLLYKYNLVTFDSEVDDWINITVDYHQLCSWLSITTNSLLHEKAMLSMLMEAKHAQEEQFD